MRRLLLPFVLAAAVASPAAAEPDGLLCAGVVVSGDRVPPVSPGTHCVGEEYRYEVWCHETDAWVDPHVLVETWICVPGG